MLPVSLPHPLPFAVAILRNHTAAISCCHFEAVSRMFTNNFYEFLWSIMWDGWVRGPMGVAGQPPGILHKKNSDPGGLSHLRRRSCCCRPLAAAVVAIVCTVVVVAFDPGVLPPPRPPTPPRITKNLYRMSDFLC